MAGSGGPPRLSRAPPQGSRVPHQRDKDRPPLPGAGPLSSGSSDLGGQLSPSCIRHPQSPPAEIRMCQSAAFGGSVSQTPLLCTNECVHCVGVCARVRAVGMCVHVCTDTCVSALCGHVCVRAWACMGVRARLVRARAWAWACMCGQERHAHGHRPLRPLGKGVQRPRPAFSPAARVRGPGQCRLRVQVSRAPGSPFHAPFFRSPALH